MLLTYVNSIQPHEYSNTTRQKRVNIDINKKKFSRFENYGFHHLVCSTGNYVKRHVFPPHFLVHNPDSFRERSYYT